MSDVTTATAPTLTAGNWIVDPTHSTVGFTVRHLGLSKVRGRFNRFDAAATIGENELDSRVTASVELASVDTNNPDRDAHLQSTDFFNTESSPTMEFVTTGVRPNGENHVLEGELTIAGTTRPAAFDLELGGVATDPYGNTKSGFSATGYIKRSDFGIDFNVPLGADAVLIGDKVDIELEIQLVPQA